MTVCDGWVWARNVRITLERLSALLDYGFDDSDWGAVETLLPDTFAAEELWCSYPLVGATQLWVELARDLYDEPERVSVRVSGSMDECMQARVQTVLAGFTDANISDVRFGNY